MFEAWKAWAKETVPTPTDDGWARVEHFVATWNNVGGGLTERLTGKRSHYINIGGVLPFSIEKARALLAHLNEVATGLSADEWQRLSSATVGPTPSDGCVRLVRLRLVTLKSAEWLVYSTSFGRAVLRVRKAD